MRWIVVVALFAIVLAAPRSAAAQSECGPEQFYMLANWMNMETPSADALGQALANMQFWCPQWQVDEAMSAGYDACVAEGFLFPLVFHDPSECSLLDPSWWQWKWGWLSGYFGERAY